MQFPLQQSLHVVFESLFPPGGGSFCNKKQKAVFLLTKQMIMLLTVDRK